MSGKGPYPMMAFIARAGRVTRWLRYSVAMGAPASVIRANLQRMLSRQSSPIGPKDALAFKEIVARGDFTADWFTSNIITWLRVFHRVGWLAENAGPVRALEIGSWEGMSSLFILSQFPSVELTCVDTWLGGDENVNNASLSTIEQRFDSNVRAHAGRVTKWNGTSAAFFASSPATEEFDFIYVDGSHFVDDVLLDSLCAFQRLRVGGVIIFDDYQWRNYSQRQANPAAALNAFFRLKSNEIELLSAGHQIIARRVRPALREIVGEFG